MVPVERVVRMPRTGRWRRVEALIDTNMGFPRIVYMRDLTSLDSPRAFNLPLQQTQQ